MRPRSRGDRRTATQFFSSSQNSCALSNGSRLSCGRNRRGRKVARPPIEARRRGNAIPPTRAPDSFKRLLGGSFLDGSAVQFSSPLKQS